MTNPHKMNKLLIIEELKSLFANITLTSALSDVSFLKNLNVYFKR